MRHAEGHMTKWRQWARSALVRVYAPTLPLLTLCRAVTPLLSSCSTLWCYFTLSLISIKIPSNTSLHAVVYFISAFPFRILRLYLLGQPYFFFILLSVCHSFFRFYMFYSLFLSWLFFTGLFFIFFSELILSPCISPSEENIENIVVHCVSDAG